MSAYGSQEHGPRGDEGGRLRLRLEALQARRGACSSCARPRSASGSPRENRRLRTELAAGYRASTNLVGASEPMHEVLRQVRKVAPQKTTVLVTGESRHRQGARRARAARALAARGHALRRRELRRDPRRAHRDRAVRPREGRLHRRARRDEEGALRARPTAARSSSTRSASCRSPLQVKLLRFLAGGGGPAASATRARAKVDVRVVAATARDLRRAVAERASSARTSSTGSTW